MKVKIWLMAVLASVLVLAGAPTRAVQVGVTVGGSEQFFDGERQLKDELAPFAAIELRMTERWGAEIWYLNAETDNEMGLETDIERWQAGFLYYLRPSGAWQPYFAFGGGQLKSEVMTADGGMMDDIDDEEANIGLGVRYFVTDNISLRGDTRYIYGFDDESHDLAFSLGVAVHFGSVESWPSTQRDSDGDGVPDDRDDCPYTPRRARVNDRGCEVAVDRVASIKLLVHFDFDRTVVKQRYFTDIRGLADYLKQNPEIYVQLEGHTDSVGSDLYNLNLSQRRAEAVMQLLANEYGIPSRRLVAKGYGETLPVESNETNRGRAANRRVIAVLEVEYGEGR